MIYSFLFYLSYCWFTQWNTVHEKLQNCCWKRKKVKITSKIPRNMGK